MVREEMMCRGVWAEGKTRGKLIKRGGENTLLWWKLVSKRDITSSGAVKSHESHAENTKCDVTASH